MNNIQIIDGVKLTAKGLLVKDSSKHWVPLHRQQGDMDGACAVYCLMMSLFILGYISEKDIEIHNSLDRRTSRGKFIAHFLEDQGLIRTGYSYISLAKEVRSYCKELNAERKKPRDLDRRIGLIADYIMNDIPVIISIVYSCGNTVQAHAILAVGIEADKNDNIVKILCLDPGGSSPQCSIWNCFIDVSKNNDKEYPFWCVTNQNTYKVSLDDMIIIQYNE